MAISAIKLKQREVGPHKAIVAPLFETRNVLTNNPWTFTALWLKRNRKQQALFFWEQAQEFHKASVGLPLRSAPLLLYYSFMNATKALLVSRGLAFDERHGVVAFPRVAAGGKRSFLGEGIMIHPSGILPSLSHYYQEPEPKRIHSLKDLLANMVFIHRTYCLTFGSHKEMYIPLANCAYVFDTRSREVFLKADVEKNTPLSAALRSLPPTFKPFPALGPRSICSVARLKWAKPEKPTAANVKELANYNGKLRRELHFINGAQTLWYLKISRKGQRTIERQLPTMILGVMHRLSEICRYHPLQLESLLSGDKNWLLSEFIQTSAAQFIDEIASEITGHQFLIPNVRAPS